jgi:hypothetical protein
MSTAFKIEFMYKSILFYGNVLPVLKETMVEFDVRYNDRGSVRICNNSRSEPPEGLSWQQVRDQEGEEILPTEFIQAMGEAIENYDI